MKKSSLSSIIPIIFLSMLTKIISMSSRIIMSRDLGVEAVSIYSLVNPMFVFLITLVTFSLPTTISTLISKYPNYGKKIFLTSLIICIILNFIFIVILSLTYEFFAINVLHNPDTIYSLKLLSLVIPLTTISSLIKGYYMGKKELILTSESSLVEECGRLISIILLLGIFNNLHNSVKATFFILVLIIGEIIQTTFLLLSSGKKYISNIKKLGGIFDSSNYIFSNIFNISFPITLSRIITSFTYMIEPILITNILLNFQMSSEQITLQYGILSSYVMPLLLFPGFFSLSIGNFLLPNLSSLIGKKDYFSAKKTFNKSLLITLIIGIFFSLFFFFFGDQSLNFIYHIDQGQKEIKVLSLPFIIYYIETPINVAMHAINKTKNSFFSSLIAAFCRILLIIVLSPFLSVFSICIATLASCYLDVLINFFTIRKFFKRHNV